MGTDLLSDIRREIDERLVRLRPLLVEYEQLLRAAEALGLEEETPAAGPAPVTRRAARSERENEPPPAPEPQDAASGSPNGAPGSFGTAGKTPGAGREEVRQAILDALEHGSHTVGELIVVTAMSAPSINASLRRLADAGAIARTEREGKAAWSLADAD